MTRAATSRTDVVLLHGWGMRKSVWQEMSVRLPPRMRVNAIDLPGYGGATVCQPYTVDAMAKRLAKDAPQRCAVAGWSLGGVVALRWAALFPQQVTRVALIATTPCFVARPDWLHGMNRGTFDGFRMMLRDDPQSALARFSLLQAEGEAEVRAVAKRLRSHAGNTMTASSAALEGGLAILHDTDLRSELRAVMQPVLILHGENDDVVPVAAAQHLATALPDARIVIFPGVGHAPLVSKPGTVAGYLMSFLDG